MLPHTSDKQEGAVVADAPPGHDAKCVQTLVVLVQLPKGQRGLALPKVHLGPLGLLEQDVCEDMGLTYGPAMPEALLPSPPALTLPWPIC